MPLLQVRDFPPELYTAISRVARSENRSIPQQTIVLLKTSLNLTEERKTLRKAVLKEIDNFNIKGTNNFPPPEEMIREDRDE